MFRITSLILAMLIAVFATAAHADSYVEDFEDTQNQQGWSYGPPQSIETSGGNPGQYLRVQGLDTFAPQPATIFGANDMTGDFRAMGVTSIGIDLITHAVDFSAEGRQLSLILRHDNGTPNDLFDDWGAAFVGNANIPLEGEGWISYSFAIPSQETDLPAGWRLMDFSGAGMPGGDWNDLMGKVDRVSYFYGDPDWFYIFQQWDVGMDNASITCEPTETIECAASLVNAGCGDTEDILFMNGSTGGSSRIVNATTTDAITLSINEPASRHNDGQSTNCCVYAWLGEPGENDTVVLPKNLGSMCFGPKILTTRNPKKIWNSIGFDARLGADNGPGAEPVIPNAGSFTMLDLPTGLGSELSVTFQGLVEDTCTQGTVPFSVTNGFVLRIQD